MAVPNLIIKQENANKNLQWAIFLYPTIGRNYSLEDSV